MLRVGHLRQVNGQNSTTAGTQEIKYDTTVSVWGSHKPSTAAAADTDQKKINDYEKFQSLIKGSPIGNKFLNDEDVSRLGFTPIAGIQLIIGDDGKLTSKPDNTTQLMDGNGGLHYENKKSGGTLRVCEFEKSLQYKKGNMTQTQWFDDNGKPSGGMVTVKNEKTGEITKYNYELDINGNQFITGVKTEKPEGHQKPDKYADFNNAFKETALTDKFTDGKELEAKGWKKEMYMDQNGGQYYNDPKTGTTVRVMPQRLFGDGSCMSVRTDNMAHFAAYDNNGKETGGVIQIRQPDGSIKIYDYSVDVDGNRFIKSEEISDLDYFAEYE